MSYLPTQLGGLWGAVKPYTHTTTPPKIDTYNPETSYLNISKNWDLGDSIPQYTQYPPPPKISTVLFGYPMVVSSLSNPTILCGSTY